MKKMIYIILFFVAVCVIGFLIARSHGNKKVITEAEARIIAETKIKADTSPEYANEMIITSVEKRGDGWVFSYTTKKYLDTKNPLDLVPGSNPLFVGIDGSTKYQTVRYEK